MGTETVELFGRLRARFGSHSEAARQLNLPIRSYRRMRQAGKIKPQVRRLAELLLNEPVEEAKAA
jgi:hypothetical protein